MSEPKISVIMPAYNAEKYIKEAIDSILEQTFADFEFIIIDDGSTDSTAEIVQSYSDKRIRFFPNERNIGVAATLNRGLELARGEYIARMDSDDISMPTRFEKQTAYMDEHDEITVLATNVQNFGANKPFSWPTSSSHEALKVDLLFNCCICHPTVMMRGNVVRQNGLLYDERFNKMEDYELWERMFQQWKFACIQDVLYKYRVHERQTSLPKSEQSYIQYMELKRRMLSRINADVYCLGFECFVRFCYGNFTLTKSEKESMREFLIQIKQNNMVCKQYDEPILEQSLRAVLLRSFDNSGERIQFFYSHPSLFKCEIKRCIMRLKNVINDEKHSFKNQAHISTNTY